MASFKPSHDQIMSKIKESTRIDGQCHIWEGGFAKDGKPHFYNIHSSGRNKHAHIWSREIYEKRERLPHEVTRHLCGNRVCVNPEHLLFGTNTENSNDAFIVGSKAAKLTIDDVRYIRASNMSTKDLSIKYSVHYRSIYCVRSGRTWKGI